MEILKTVFTHCRLDFQESHWADKKIFAQPRLESTQIRFSKIYTSGQEEKKKKSLAITYKYTSLGKMKIFY